ncbi:MAG: GGDEF domain-containing protein [Ilumatobacteraceae bacterium]|nr:GGDEF domain-containing protein [Ilumatobacteraceae bacterium]
MSTLNRVEQLVLGAVKRRGVGGLVSVVTIGSVALSLAVTSVVLILTGAEWIDFQYALPIAVVVPSVVAPVVALMLGRLLLALDEASAQLHRAARHDGLTGVLNRSGFDEMGERLLHDRTDEVVVVCMVDVDRFKSVNDEEGHAVGDALLQGLAASLVVAAGADGIVGRYGGDEFAIAVLCRPDDAGPLVDRIVEACEPTDQAHGVGASVGTLVTDSPVALDDAIAAADRAMYRAKRDGSRHHVSVDGSGPVEV